MDDGQRTEGGVVMVTDGGGNARLVTQDETPSPAVVILSDDQWSFVQGAVRQLCSECLVVVVLLGISCGIAAWRVLSDGWR